MLRHNTKVINKLNSISGTIGNNSGLKPSGKLLNQDKQLEYIEQMADRQIVDYAKCPLCSKSNERKIHVHCFKWLF